MENPLRSPTPTPDTGSAPSVDPAKLREFFDDPGSSVEQAVVIGDDFELVREGGDVSEVIADFRDATREILDLDDHQAHYDLGTTYLEMELFDDAVAEFEIAARGGEFALPSQEMLGYCFLRKGQIDLAIRELEKALALPGYEDHHRLGIHYNLGIACGVTDREAEAIEHFQKILEIDPNFRDTRSRLERLVQNSH
jgi:tetratricopeptide (TPR) repeat protein